MEDKKASQEKESTPEEETMTSFNLMEYKRARRRTTSAAAVLVIFLVSYYIMFIFLESMELYVEDLRPVRYDSVPQQTVKLSRRDDVALANDEITAEVAESLGLNRRYILNMSKLQNSGTVILNTTEYMLRDAAKSADNSSEDVSTNKSKSEPLYLPPPGETRIRRYPQAVIIGFPKCGTRALLFYLHFHPYIQAAGPEVHFYDWYFYKGYDWYLQQVPPSYSNQITMEKTPSYSRIKRARLEMKQKFPDIKLICVVCNPVKRVISHEAQASIVKDREEGAPITVEFTKKDGITIDPESNAISRSRYAAHLEPWFRDFPKEHFLIVSGEELITDPLSVVQRAETFLKIPKLFTKDNFVINKTSGFYCARGFNDDEGVMNCLGGSKGREHKELPKNYEKILYDYFRPYNEWLFKMIGYRFDWEAPQD